MDKPTFVEACLPNITHRYYGTYHFNQCLKYERAVDPLIPIAAMPAAVDQTSQSILLDAIRRNDLDIVRLNLTICNQSTLNGFTALHLAAKRGFLSIVEALIDLGNASVDAVDIQQETALLKAASGGHIEVMRYLLSKNACANHCDVEGWSALHIASSKGFINCVELLLGNQTDVNLQSKSGYTALMNASTNGFDDIVVLLLRHKADHTIKNSIGDYAYDLAAQNEFMYICDLLRDAEKPFQTNIVYSSIYELIYEHQATSFWSKKIAATNMAGKAGWTDRFGDAQTMNQIHLPLKWCWLTDWKVDVAYPGVDEEGWQIYGDNAGYLGQNFRKRRWFRVRKLKYELIKEEESLDYLQAAQKKLVYNDSLPNRDLDKAFASCQDIIETLLKEMQVDAECERKIAAAQLVETLLSKAELLKKEIDIQDYERHTPLTSTKE